MTSAPLVAHSLAEVYLYLMAARCDACGAGPLQAPDARRSDAREELQLTLDTTCRACGAQRALEFRLPEGTGEVRPSGVAQVNPTSEPSRIIDVAQWITLFRTIVELAERQTDRQEARRLGIEAAQCLEEALKFYEDDNDLPPADALFHEDSRERLRSHPDRFSRQRLLDLRGRLPSMGVMQQRTAEGTKQKRRWWRFGR